MKTDEEWKKQLDEEEFDVLRQKGTERSFTGKYWDNHEKGDYLCRGCGNLLFKFVPNCSILLIIVRSDHKFDSGTGWPSFWQPAQEKGSVLSNIDNSIGWMPREEVVCIKVCCCTCIHLICTSVVDISVMYLMMDLSQPV